MLILEAQERTKAGKSKDLKPKGVMPAVYYGPKEDSTSISVDQTEFLKAWREAGESTVVTLKTPAGEKSTIIHDVQLDPVTHTPIHADFYVVEAGKEVEVTVPLEFDGVSPAVKELGGVLVKVLHEIDVKAMPNDLPHEIMVDISTLTDMDSQIAIQDLTLPKGVTALGNPDEVVAAISAAQEEEEGPTEVDMDAIEVEQKGKKEEEGESA